MGYSYSIIVDEISVEAVKMAVISTYTKEVLKTQKAVKDTAFLCAKKTKQRCPVGTPQSTHKKNYIGGVLRTSYDYLISDDELEAIVYTNIYYGKFVELGTYKMAAQPHLYPSFVDGAVWLMAAMGVQL